MAGLGVLITSVIFITIVTGDTLQLGSRQKSGQARLSPDESGLTSAPNPATTICTNVGNFSGQMRTTIIVSILTTALWGQVNSQDKRDSLKYVIQEFYFNLPTDVSLDSLGQLLSNNRNFKRGWGKTYDPKRTIDGKILRDKNLNSNADYNQLLVSVWRNTHSTRDTLRFGWYISYGFDELGLATKDRDDFKSKFSPLFSEMSESTDRGYHGEINEYILLRTANKDLEIRLTKHERPGRHRVSITYTEIRE
jgi:hypothetical protein